MREVAPPQLVSGDREAAVLLARAAAYLPLSGAAKNSFMTKCEKGA